MKVDLCCGGHPKKGFEGLDVLPEGNVKFVVDLNKEKLPFKDNSVDEFYEQYSFYELDNPMSVIKDCWRCLKPGGVLEFKELYFASPFAFLPYTKNFWGFHCERLFTNKLYRDNGDWEVVSVDFETSGIPPKWFVNLNRKIYEKYFSRLLPIHYIVFKLKKPGLFVYGKSKDKLKFKKRGYVPFKYKGEAILYKKKRS